jgi:hypothetical protein
MVEQSAVDSLICHKVRIRTVSRRSVAKRYKDSRKDGEDDLECSRSEVTQSRIDARNTSVADGIEALVLTSPMVQYSTRTQN